MQFQTALIFVALILGLGWAIRGHFGHEWGASWAGAMAGLAVIVISNRRDWLSRLPVLVFLAGIGWGVGGIMSYGLVVGFCCGSDFGNVIYGFTMLMVIGGLYGYIGGGLFGLGLESSDQKKADWATLFTQMIAAGYLFWGILIWQFEWKMTPPRSELWAACLGAAAALSWYVYRNRFNKALRVAAYSALGAGFGFSFGNFLQIMGNLTGLPFNWWNLMEFTLGFCGGLGLAYGIFSQKWSEKQKPSNFANWWAWMFLIFIIPVINLLHAFDKNEFVDFAKSLGHSNPEQFANNQFLLGFASIACFTLLGVFLWKHYQDKPNQFYHSNGVILLLGYSIYYILLSHLKKGFLYGFGGLQLEQYAYWVIILITFLMWFVNRKSDKIPFLDSGKGENWSYWFFIVIILTGILILLTVISINSHDGLGTVPKRF
jgi:magnesium-transporting ATPase (P-type)